MKFELSTRSKLLLVVGVPTTALIIYWLLKSTDDDDDEVEENREKTATSRQTIIEIKVPQNAVGPIIGRQGSMIKEIQEVSGARVNFRDDNRNSQEERVVVVRGKTEAAQMAENMIRKIITELPVIVTEEMIVPGTCIGRIIGKNGDTIRQISRTSHAKVFVDRTRDDYRDAQKAVTITGTRDQIEVARSMIQEKIDDEAVFRAKKAVMEANREQRPKNKHKDNSQSAQLNGDSGSETGLEQHPTVRGWPDGQGDSGITSAPEIHPAVRGWPEGKDFIEVYVSAVANPGLFWVQPLSSMSVELDRLVDRITSLYTSEVSKDYIIGDPVVGQLVAAPFENDPSWYRAKVMSVEGDTVDLYYVDYGDSSYLPCDKIRRLRSEFEVLPFQAIECHLAHIKPVGDSWSEDSTDVFDELTYAAKWKVLMAKKVGHRDTSTSTVPVVELIDTNGDQVNIQDVKIDHEMVKRGYAVWNS